MQKYSPQQQVPTQASLGYSVLAATAFTGLLWWIKLCESLFGWDLHELAIYPRATSGLIGIITAPLIHGSWQHLSSNTLPILLLGSILLYGYPRSRWWTLGLVWLLSGLGVWIFGRTSYHFGASGLSHGMFFFLFVGGILRRDKRSIALLMVAFFMYGTMLVTIFPQGPGISFEYHLFGALGGSLCALGFRHQDPKAEEKSYSWEQAAGDEADSEDPIIGDQWKIDSDNKPDDRM